MDPASPADGARSSATTSGSGSRRKTSWPGCRLSVVKAGASHGRRRLNDAAALGAADVGLAVSDDTACVVPACDGVVAGRHVPHVPQILQFARRTRQVIVTSFVVSVAYNVAGLSLALSGLLTPLAAAILMPVSSLTVVAISIGATRRFSRAVPA
jgi:Cu+-exporting ATPase